MQMFHEGCQCVKENLLPVSDARDKQFHGMKNNAEGEGRTRLCVVPSECYSRCAVMHVGDNCAPRATVSLHLQIGKLFFFLSLVFPPGSTY